MKTWKLSLVLIFLIFCNHIKLEAKPRIAIRVYLHAYGIIENGKINGIKISEKDIDEVDKRIYKDYGIKFRENYRIIAPNKKKIFGKNYIQFYNDIKLIINGKEYIISKGQIKIDPLNSKDGPVYPFEPPIDIRHTKDKELIIDIGEIEILDKDGQMVKSKTKIPPILFKKTYFTIKYNNIKGSSQETLYSGWAEDFPEDLKQLLKK